MGRSEGGLAVVTMQQTPHANSGGLPGNLSMKDAKSNDKVKVLSDEEAIDDFPIGMRVLVVDDDPICLLLLESLLCHCKYNVMSANGETSAVMKGITHGGCEYLLKHVRIEELKNIWQHVVRKKRTDSKDRDHLDHGDANEKFNHGTKDGEHGSSANDGTNRSWKLNRKRKEQNDDEDEHDTEDPSTSKKPRVVWSVELHQQFVNAVNTLGIDTVYAKEEDTGTFTIKVVDDPRTLNKTLYLRLPANTFSFNELVGIWEKKIDKTLDKVYVPKEEVLKLITETPFPGNISIAIRHSIFVKGDQTNFEIGPDGVEAS